MDFPAFWIPITEKFNRQGLSEDETSLLADIDNNGFIINIDIGFVAQRKRYDKDWYGIDGDLIFTPTHFQCIKWKTFKKNNINHQYVQPSENAVFDNFII